MHLTTADRCSLHVLCVIQAPQPGTLASTQLCTFALHLAVLDQCSQAQAPKDCCHILPHSHHSLPTAVEALPEHHAARQWLLRPHQSPGQHRLTKKC